MKAHHALMLVSVLLTVESPAGSQPETARATQNPSLKKAAQDSPQELWQAQRELAADFRAFSAGHAKDAPEARRLAMEAFQKQNQSRTEALRAKSKAIARARSAPEIPTIQQVAIPANASPAMEELIVQRAQMMNERAKLLNSLRNATPEAKEAELQNWQRKNEPALAALRERVALIAEAKPQEPLPSLPPPRIPNGASAELRSFLVERHAQMQDRMARVNRQRGLGPDSQAPASSPIPAQAHAGEAAATPLRQVTSQLKPTP